MSYSKKLSVLLLVDVFIVWFSVITAYLFRYDGSIPSDNIEEMLLYGATTAFCIGLSSFYFRLYNRIWQYASIEDMVSIFKAIMTGVFASTILTDILFDETVSLAIVFRTLQSCLLLIGGSRFAWRLYRDRNVRIASTASNALIIGAGDCGTMIVKELRQNPNLNMMPVAFIDDEVKKHNHQLFGITVMGGRERIIQLVKELEIEHIIIAMPSVSKKTISEIINICKQTNAKVKIIPKIDVYIENGGLLKQIRDVDVEDLLGREPVHVDLDGIANYVKEKVVLVTGAGGSIGSELCRQILPFRPSKLLLLGHGENSIYTIENELRASFPFIELETIIADVQDRERIESVFKTFKPHCVFHAAAHKHVPLMEKNPSEAIKNNVFGTRNVAEMADQYGAERFVLISTDKAVNPTSVMGATKRIAEMIVQSLDKTSHTKFAAVRFGNVLGSRGSVIPRFKEQIAAGGPVTVTHPEMIRYFMTIPEAVQLVIQAGSLAKGGEVFILDMGDPVKIVDLATDLIKLSGFEPNEDIDVVFTGIRPGEKLYEELLTQEEGTSSTVHNRIFVAKPVQIDRAEMSFQVKRLEKTIQDGPEEIKTVIKHIVPTFSNVG